MNPSRILIALLCLPAAVLAEDPQKVPLWPNGAPGFEARRGEAEQAKSYWVRNIHNPSITVFLPPKEKATGAAVLICPGGGHRELVFNLEGVDAARYLNSIGVAAFVLKYRLGRERGTPYSVEKHAREDGVRAMRLVRSRAQEWGIDPGRVGIMGFSAGGEVASMVTFGPNDGDPKATDPVDRLSSRPDFLVMIYPGPIGIPDVLPPKPPPAFLIVANDDRGASRVIASLFQKYRDARAPVEAHIFARGGHGFNMGKRSRQATLKSWPQRLADWMADNEILTPARKPPAANSSPAEPAARMTVTGRVLDPQGKPVPHASVMIYAQSRVLGLGIRSQSGFPAEIGRATSDGSGRFRVEVPRTSSSRHAEFGAVALAPGYAVGWGDLDPDADQPTADIALRPEQVIHGRLFDLQGQPARDVKLSVTAIRRVLLRAPNARQESFEGPRFWWTHPDDLPGWPSPAISGADGRFTVHGVGPGLRVFLNVLTPRYAIQSIEINTDVAANEKSLSFALQPARTISGRVTYADTGKPVPHTQVIVSGFDQYLRAVGPHPILSESDAEGQFRSNTGSGAEGVVYVAPPDGQPYLRTFKRIDWPKGAVTYSVDLALPRGVMMRGMVTEQGSGRPVSGATVTFRPHTTANDQAATGLDGPVETGADGSFAFPVMARRGYLIVQGLSDDYVFQAIDRGLLLTGQPGGRRAYTHGFLAIDPKPDSESLDVKVALRPGATVQGQVVGPDGNPVPDAWMISRIHYSRRNPLLRMWSGDEHGIARHSRFELHGLDPDSEVPVSFFEPKRKLGATVRFSGKPASAEPITVRLESCGTATARLVGPDGKPLGGIALPAPISMVVTPGEFSDIKARKDGTTFADEASLTLIDPINYPKAPASDAQGRIVFPALIPGATYRIIDRTTNRDPDGPQLRKEFTVKPGETLDLGEIRIEKPRP